MRIELINLHKRLGTTFVYVTHDQTEAMTMGERIAVMKDGIIQQMDTPENIYKNPVNIFTAGFIGSPQMNFIEDRDKNITMGVRPEKLKILSASEEKDDSLSFDECYVEAVELIGSEKLIYFDYRGLKLVSKVPEDIQTVKGSGYKLYCLKRDIHYFDREKGEKIIL